MPRYSVLIKPSAVKEIEGIALKRDRQRMVNRIKKLASNPRPSGSEKLLSQEKYRIRQGQYRVIYSISDKDLGVYVVKVGHRKDVYRVS